MTTIINSDVTAVTAGAPTRNHSAVSWAAILAGAIVALATTLIILALGAGLGFAAASPWPGTGPSATTFAVWTGIWLIVSQWLSAALGGYITGRLRTRWTAVHSHEVFFRDTAHGLVAWAVATAIVAAVALSATSSTLAATTNAAGGVGYVADTMLRTDRPAPGDAAAVRAEIGRLLMREGPVTADDRAYLAHVVARQTGVSDTVAQQRVDAAITSVREAADKARKVSSAVGLFTALSMLIGAFIASVAAAYAGRLRDDVDAERR
jgi:hypothetical protein